MTKHVPPVPTSDMAEDQDGRRRAALAHVKEALDRGLLTSEDVDRFVSRTTRRDVGARPTAALVLYAIGAVVVFAGVALAYSTIYDGLPRALRLTTPFLFPAIALAACVGLRRRRLAAWSVELSGLVAYVAVAGACVTVGAESGWLDTDHDLALYTVVCASIGCALAVGCFALVRSVRLLVLGTGATLAAIGLGVAELTGILGEGTWSWVLLVEAAIAAGAALALVPRSRRACQYVTYWALLGVWASSVAGVSFTGPEDLSLWHATLATGIVLAFVVAGTMNFNGLLWLAALAGLQWLQAIAVVVGSATNAAFAVILAGLGLLAIGLLVVRLQRRIRPG
jgi:hypothetical protein